jgi:hypothetical protein
MENRVLSDKEKLPTNELLQEVLGNCYTHYDALTQTITSPDLGLMPEWNYYNDGKSWLCKVIFKKKTIFWLSVWDKCFKTTFYFTAKTIEGVYVLDIDENIKIALKNVNMIGKLIPLTISVTNKSQITDIIKIIQYKKSLK